MNDFKRYNFKKLKIWQMGLELSKFTLDLTDTFPTYEKYGLKSQMDRYSISIPSNIAEGCSRSSNKDFSRFLEIAIGSIFEIETQLLISFDLGYINQIKLDELCFNLDRIVKMTSKFRSTLV